MNTLTLALGATALLLLATSAMALECPIPAAIDDPASAAAIAKVLPDGVDLEAPQALQSSVFELKQAAVPDDAIVDNLVAAFCNSISAQAGMPEADKTGKIEAFSDEADKAVFGAAQ